MGSALSKEPKLNEDYLKEKLETRGFENVKITRFDADKDRAGFTTTSKIEIVELSTLPKHSGGDKGIRVRIGYKDFSPWSFNVHIYMDGGGGYFNTDLRNINGPLVYSGVTEKTSMHKRSQLRTLVSCGDKRIWCYLQERDFSREYTFIPKYKVRQKI